MGLDIENILPDKDFPDYTAFSSSSNPLYFEFTIPYLKEKLREECPLGADKDHFEELLIENPDLQAEYVEHYHQENEFYVTQSKYRGILFDIYYIARYGAIVMFFTRKAP